MRTIINLDKYPLDRRGSSEWDVLVGESIEKLNSGGMVNLEDFLMPGLTTKAVSEIQPIMDTRSYTHRRMHNIYFRPEIPEVAPEHPALRKVETRSHTVCADQMPKSIVLSIYEYEPVRHFLAAITGKPALYVMEDPLARVNVMSYRSGDTLNWHFDRAEFTTTLLLQAPEAGGAFEYRSDLRSDDDPNYDGVAKLLEGRDPKLQSITLKAGTLNVFRGKNTAHRVTTVQGQRERMVAVFSYYEKSGVMFSDEERIGFYGRTA